MKILLVVILHGLVLSCKSNAILEDTGKVKQEENQPNSAEQTPPEEGATTDKETATVDVPENITGGYLVCESESLASPQSPAGTVTCAVRDPKTNNRVDLNQNPNFKSWGFTLAQGVIATVEQTLLSSDIEWHVRYSIQAATPDMTNSIMINTKFFAEYSVNGEITAKVSTTIAEKPSVSWTSQGSNPIPANAAPGGTEGMNTIALYLCRNYSSDGIIPGKLLYHHQEPTRSVCYHAFNGSTSGSLSGDGQTLTMENDVLVIEANDFLKYFEWVDVVDGLIPANALVTGRLNQGDYLSTCRGLESGTSQDPNKNDNDPNGEWIPGYIGPNSNGCVHEFYGEHRSVTFQVLAWKEQVVNANVEFTHQNLQCVTNWNPDSNSLQVDCPKQNPN